MKNKKCIIALIPVLLSGCSFSANDEQITDYDHYYDTTVTSAALSSYDTDETDFVITEDSETELPEAPLETIHGNAENINGKTVIVSIFANDTKTSWDYESDVDVRTMYQTISYMDIATDWLEKQVALYEGNAEFIFDWETNQDLFYGANFYQDMAREDSTYYVNQKFFIDNYIDSEELKKKYDADNILYVFFFNSDFSNQTNPWASPSPYIYEETYNTEFVNIFVCFDDFHIAMPSTYAHEILHTFGAHDLYYENYAVSQAYVDYCTETGSNDIMYTVSDGEEILNELSELDAYYLGLVESSADVEKWGLILSEFE